MMSVELDSLRHRFASEILPGFVFDDPHVFLSVMNSDLAPALLHELWRRLADESKVDVSTEAMRLDRERLDEDRAFFTIEIGHPTGGPAAELIAVVPFTGGCRYLTLERKSSVVDPRESIVLCERYSDGSHHNWDTLRRSSRGDFVAAVQELVQRSELRCLGCDATLVVRSPGERGRQELHPLSLQTCPCCHLTLPLALAGEDKNPHRLQRLREFVLSPLYMLGVPLEALQETANSDEPSGWARLTLAMRALDCLDEGEAWVECLLQRVRLGERDLHPGVERLLEVLTRYFEHGSPSLRTKLCLCEVQRRAGALDRARAAALECLEIVRVERPPEDLDAVEAHRAALRHESRRLIREIERAHRRKVSFFDRADRDSVVLTRVWQLLCSRRDVVEEELADGLRQAKRLAVWDRLECNLSSITERDGAGPEWPTDLFGPPPLWWGEVGRSAG